ncbi:MAG: anhydro-N-acetylmuramic acid kinase [Planctomycetes bacterium]|nr:anhydro-N-acetylmuramic acid kinase [Planctomycetota bacterium]
MDRLLKLRAKSERIVIGLNSGTSADAIDSIVVRFRGQGLELVHEVLASGEHPWPASVREQLLRAGEMSVAEAADLHVALGAAFALAARAAMVAAGLSADGVDLIGSHGQTVVHHPCRGPGTATATLQLGDIDVIAERTGVITVGDFRARDAAAGGQGAPLMPFLDWMLFRQRPGTVCLNLGGIANVTMVASDIEECVAFDTGPANMPLDLIASRLTNGVESYDPGGRLAEQGHVDAILLDRLMQHPYIHATPPKTTGREEFGSDFVRNLLAKETHMPLVDILATLTSFVADSVHAGVTQWAVEPLREVVVSGGGLHNLALMRRLKQRFFPVPVTSIADYGVNPDSKEALLFALLAHERVLGGATNVPRATGALWPTGLGKIAL